MICQFISSKTLDEYNLYAVLTCLKLARKTVAKVVVLRV